MTVKRIPYGVMMPLTLVISWAGVTTVLALAFWRMKDGASEAALQWGTIWLFTVLLPTSASLKLHRRLNQLVQAVPDLPDAALRDVAHARWQMLIFGGLSAMAAVSLVLAP